MLQMESMLPVESADDIVATAVQESEDRLDTTFCQSAPDPTLQTNSLQLNLQTGGLAVQLRTQTSVTSQLVELSTKVDILSAQVQQANARLELAWHRVGYLEAKLEYKDLQIEAFLRNQPLQ